DRKPCNPIEAVASSCPSHSIKRGYERWRRALSGAFLSALAEEAVYKVVNGAEYPQTEMNDDGRGCVRSKLLFNHVQQRRLSASPRTLERDDYAWVPGRQNQLAREDAGKMCCIEGVVVTGSDWPID